MIKITLILYEVCRSLSLDQTELHILDKGFRLNHKFDPHIHSILIYLILTKIDIFLVIVDKGGEISHKDRNMTKEGV
jgi:hypothetical protein